jgi:hypothetical protein
VRLSTSRVAIITTSRKAMYHSRVKEMDKMDAVEKPTTGRGTGPPNIVK